MKDRIELSKRVYARDATQASIHRVPMPHRHQNVESEEKYNIASDVSDEEWAQISTWWS
jgi:hypothetical protein